MTPADLDPIKARLAAATPGPWEWSVRPRRHMLIHRFSERGHPTVLETEGDSEHAKYPCANEADRAFIEHAPSDIASLIAEVERLRARLREVTQILIEHTGASGPMDAEDAARKVVGELAEQIAVNTELAACLKWYVEEDDAQEGGHWEEWNAPWLEGKRRAMRALKMEEE